MKGRRLLLATILLALMTVLVSCSHQLSLLTVNPVCELPCWKGIEMNMPMDQVVNLLSKIPEVDFSSILKQETPNRNLNTNVSVNLKPKTFDYAIFYFADNQLKVMVFYYPRGRASKLGYWIDEFGNPSEIMLHGGGLSYGYMSHSYLYDDIPVCLDGYIRGAKTPFNVTKNIKIESVVIFDPSFDKAIANTSCYSPNYEEQNQPWTGYGKYQVCPNPDFPCN